MAAMEKGLRMQNLGQTYAHQAELPRLPVPELEQTMDRLLEWTEPLVSAEVFADTRRRVETFRNEEGPRLQEALRRFSGEPSTDNWLEPFWFEHYLVPREPVPVNVNIFYLFDRNSRSEGMGQVERAADIVASAAEFKVLLDHEAIPPDSERGTPLCMDQFHRMFSSTRIPRPSMDTIRSPVMGEPPVSTNERHIAVLCGGRIFALDVFDEAGAIRHRERLVEDLAAILQTARDNPLPDGESLCLGTTMERDGWAAAREHLLSLDETNRASLDTLERALLAISLDPGGWETMDELSAIMLHSDGRNQWFDKPLHIIVTPDGEAAINMEHSSTDGSAIVSLSGFIHDNDGSPGDFAWTGEGAGPRELPFVFDDRLRSTLRRAAADFDALTADVTSRVVLFRDFGKERIKKVKVSPDSFIQMAIQLAQYRLFGACRSTYEAIMTRRFLKGRTEAMRSVSRESTAFVEAMEDPAADDDARAALARTALAAQSARLKECKNGQGVERHMLGLLGMYHRHGGELGIPEKPAIFGDEGFSTLTTSLLSTSTSGTRGLELAGFGPVAGDGLGIRYLTFPEAVHVNTTCRSHMTEQLERFGSLFREAMHEMAGLLERA